MPEAPTHCPDCATEVAAGLLACPGCRRLVHGARLAELAQEAERETAAGRLSEALARWRAAQELLPADSRQYERIAARIVELSELLDKGGSAAPLAIAAAPTPPPLAASPAASVRADALLSADPAAARGDRFARSPAPRAVETPPAASAGKRRGTWGAVAGVIVLVLTLALKFKSVLLIVLGKLKFVLAGLTKAKTLFSMLLSIGVYFTLFGWKFAVGLVASIYIHELGHVDALRRYGIRASAPMFIPGLGAFIAMKQYPATPREDARVGLAGPIWGLAAALACWGAFALTAAPIWAALAQVGAWINLFNLTPVWQLDGARGFRAMSRPQRWLCIGVIAALLLVTHEGLLILLGIFAVIQGLRPASERTSDWTATLQYAALVAILAGMTEIVVPGVQPA